MATNFDKALAPRPMLEDDSDVEPLLEIEIEAPKQVTLDTGDVEIILGPEPATGPDEFGANLAAHMDESQLASLANDLLADFDKDVMDRKDWADTYVEGIKLLGLKYEERTEPWDGACGVFHPMLAEAVVKFQAEAMTATFAAAGPVKTQVIGKETPEKMDAAMRVQDDMNYQLTEVMPEYRSEHERMLWSLPIAGSAFKKVYDDPALGRQVSLFVPAEDLVLPFGASTMQNAPRITHVMRLTKNDMRKLQVSGFYRDVELGDPSTELDDIEKRKAEESGMSASQDERYRTLEMHVDVDLTEYDFTDASAEDMQGVAVPYVVTIEKGSAKVLSVRRNWLEDDERRVRREHFAHYQYVPGFGVYGYGLLHLIGGYAKSATLLTRQLIDSGTLSNLPGGLKSTGLRVKGDSTPIAPGEFRDVDVPSGSIKDNIMTLPYKEPSMVLGALLDKIIQEGRAFASGGDLKVSDMSAQAPVGTTLALLERTLKVMSAIQARLHNSMRHEFKLLKSIIAESDNSSYAYEPVEGERYERRKDYALVEVLPVSDPNASTMAQKIVQYQAALQLAAGAPQLYNLPLLHRQMVEVMGLKNAEKLVPIEDDLTPIDPVQENQNVLTGKPVKAFMEQDHKSHMAVHMSAMQDPQIMQIVGQSPAAQAIMAAAMAHIQEHVAFEYRRQVEEQLGMPMPTEAEAKKMDPAVASKVAQLAAQAAQRVLQGNQAQAAQAQAAQMAQDPVIQMQQKKLELEERKVGMAEKKLMVDSAARADEQALELDKFKLEALIKMARAALDERKQVATEELGEQNTRLKAMHYGNMGRATDQGLLQADRAQALEALRTLSEIHDRNKLGESGEGQSGAAPAIPGMAAPTGGEQ